MAEEIDYGARLFDLRDSRDWTQEQLAKEAGVSHVTIVGIETGRIKRPRMGTLRRLARAFDMSLDEFLGKAPATPKEQPPKSPREWLETLKRQGILRFEAEFGDNRREVGEEFLALLPDTYVQAAAQHLQEVGLAPGDTVQLTLEIRVAETAAKETLAPKVIDFIATVVRPPGALAPKLA